MLTDAERAVLSEWLDRAGDGPPTPVASLPALTETADIPDNPSELSALSPSGGKQRRSQLSSRTAIKPTQSRCVDRYAFSDREPPGRRSRL
jgi:hypothetical protein